MCPKINCSLIYCSAHRMPRNEKSPTSVLHPKMWFYKILEIECPALKTLFKYFHQFLPVKSHFFWKKSKAVFKQRYMYVWHVCGICEIRYLNVQNAVNLHCTFYKVSEELCLEWIAYYMELRIFDSKKAQRPKVSEKGKAHQL